MGPRGDVIKEADWCIGELYDHLEENNLLENTIIIISSDNGPVLNDGYFDDAVEKLGDHTPAGKLRGGKYSLFEAGTRVPFITYWKGKTKPQVSDEIVSQIDFLNSFSLTFNIDEILLSEKPIFFAYKIIFLFKPFSFKIFSKSIIVLI